MNDSKTGILWTPTLVESTVSLLRGIEADARARKLPPPVYEAMIRLMKKISTELVIFNGSGHIWLIRRPTLEENSAEPFPGQWHVPGATHTVGETCDDAWARLIRDEVGDKAYIGLKYQIGHVDIDEPRRGMYLALIYVVPLFSGEISHRGPAGFYSPDNLPQPMVYHHEHTIIPAAMNHLSKRIKFS